MSLRHMSRGYTGRPSAPGQGFHPSLQGHADHQELDGDVQRPLVSLAAGDGHPFKVRCEGGSLGPVECESLHD